MRIRGILYYQWTFGVPGHCVNENSISPMAWDDRNGNLAIVLPPGSPN